MGKYSEKLASFTLGFRIEVSISVVISQSIVCFSQSNIVQSILSIF